MDETVRLTNADVLAIVQDLENRHREEMDELRMETASKYATLEQKIRKETASKYAKLEPKTNGGQNDKETLPESTASFFLVAKYPFIDASKGDDDDEDNKTSNSTSKSLSSTPPKSEAVAASGDLERKGISSNDNSSASLSVDLRNSDETEREIISGESDPKKSSGSYPCVDWTKRDALFLPFWFAVAALILQVAIYVMVLLNTLNIDQPAPELFQLPIGVDPWTRGAEVMAIGVTVYSQSDFFDGLNFLVYSDQLVKEKTISSGKIKFAAFTQLFTGIFGMGVTFLLIMQATEVVDLILNFSAMEFVANLDNVAFKLAESGYLWSAGEETAKVVSNTTFVVKEETDEKAEKRRRWRKVWPHVFILIVLFSLWYLIYYRQVERVYGDNKVYIQFTDGVVPWLGTLSGTYVGRHLPARENNIFQHRIIGPIVYENVEQKRYCERHGCEHGVFFYCLGEQEWHFDVAKSTSDLNCKDWVLQGIHDEPKQSGRYDVLSYSSANWFARDPKAERTIALRDEVTMMKSFNVAEYKEEEHEILESSGLPFDYSYYELVVGLRINDRPVYNASHEESGEFVAFNGYRWILVKYEDYECISCKDEEGSKCLNGCVSAFDPFYSSYKAQLISNPMTLQTSSDTWVPSDGLVWFTAKGESSGTQPADVEENAQLHVSTGSQ